MNVEVTVHDDVPPVERQIVDAGLGASNAAVAPVHEVQGISCFARIASGELVGGAVGRTWGECCELQQLWVHPTYRRPGIGTSLVKALEQRGEARGCRTFYLDTFSFQAPALYRSLGYEVAHALHGFAPGVVKYTMVRRSER